MFTRRAIHQGRGSTRPGCGRDNFDASADRRLQELDTRILAAFRHSGYAALTFVKCVTAADRLVQISRGALAPGFCRLNRGLAPQRLIPKSSFDKALVLVPSYHLKQLAQVFAQQVDGVDRIDNRLAVERKRPA